MSKAAELAKAGETLTNQPSGRKNIVTNGAMQIAQRATSTTGIGAADNVFPCVDRMKVRAGSTAGRATVSQAADGPSGFANCLKFDCTTADASIAAGEYFLLQYGIEGQDLQQLKKGTSDAEKFTVSFYVKGNANATYTCEIKDQDNTRFIAQEFSVTSSWSKVSLTFNNETSNSLDDDNAESMRLTIWLHAGSTYTGGTFTSNTWFTTANQRVGDNQTSFFDSTDREFFLTGVQMEIGSQATNFEYRSFGEELALCQRYCTVHNMSGDADEYVIPYSQGQVDSANRAEIHILYPEKRAAPTITVTNPTNFKVMTGANTAITAAGFSGALVGTGIHGANLFWGVSSGVAVNDHTGNIKNIYLFQNTGAITIDAEL